MTVLDDRVRARLGVADAATMYLAASVVLLVIGGVIRLVFLPLPGLAGDLDQFVVWMHGLSATPFGHAYDQSISFPPVMVDIWAVVGVIERAIGATPSGDQTAVTVLMKLPAVAADLALTALVGWHLRRTPGWGVVGMAMIALHPAVIDVSAMWGQYESVYLLFAALGFVLVVRGRISWAAVAIALAVMTKPQALPLVVPFAAWYLAREGWRSTIRAGAIGGVVIAALWLPFVGAAGIQHYLGNLAAYQGGIYAILSLRAWNLWWLIQEILGGGSSFIGDQSAVLGPLTFREIGYVLALMGELVVFGLVWRARTPSALAYGLAASALVAFCLLTTMHERYAYAALVFPPLAFPDRRALALALVFGVLFTLNLLAAVPPTPAIGDLVPVGGLLGIAGALGMLAVLWASIVLASSEERLGPAGAAT